MQDNDLETCTFAKFKNFLHKTAFPHCDFNYQGAMVEIDEINRVAKENPAGLIDFLKVNYPRKWVLSKTGSDNATQNESSSVVGSVDIDAAFASNGRKIGMGYDYFADGYKAALSALPPAPEVVEMSVGEIALRIENIEHDFTIIGNYCATQIAQALSALCEGGKSIRVKE